MLLRSLALVLAAATVTLSAQAAAVQPPVPPAPHLHAPVAPNPHLHGFSAISPHSAKGHITTPAHPFIHHPWANGWNVAAWRTSHVRFGEVRGTVVDASGHRAANLRVWLRYASGHPVHHHWEAHVTHTDAAGHFTMKHVIAREYRLCVKEGKTMEHEQIAVARGTSTFANFTFK